MEKRETWYEVIDGCFHRGSISLSMNSSPDYKDFKWIVTAVNCSSLIRRYLQLKRSQIMRQSSAFSLLSCLLTYFSTVNWNLTKRRQQKDELQPPRRQRHPVAMKIVVCVFITHSVKLDWDSPNKSFTQLKNFQAVKIHKYVSPPIFYSCIRLHWKPQKRS